MSQKTGTNKESQRHALLLHFRSRTELATGLDVLRLVAQGVSMPIQVTHIAKTDEIRCPFTGRLVVDFKQEPGDLPLDGTVLFVDFGVGEVETSDPRVDALLVAYGHCNPTPDEYVVDWIAARLDIDGAILIQMVGDDGEVCSFAFCPPAGSP